MRLTALVLLALSLLGSTISFAQSSRRTHDGFVASAGLGLGGGELTCGSCLSSRERAPAGYVRVGRTFGSALVLGAELNMWSGVIAESWLTFDASGSQQETRITGRRTLGTLNGVVQWYPRHATGLFLIGGVGIGQYRTHVEVTTGQRFSGHSTGLGLQAGAGYDVAVTGGLSVTPYATFFSTSPSAGSFGGASVGGNALHAGMGLGWR